MNLKVTGTKFSAAKIQRTSAIQRKYSGIPNFQPIRQITPEPNFFKKVAKFFKALYNANRK